MSIWRTTIPTSQDFPIWAFTDNDSEVVLLRNFEDFDDTITWCHADIPQPPKSKLRQKYEMLSDSSVGEAWGAYEWFKAGYRYGNEQFEGTGCCGKCQDKKSAQSPFVSPEEYWDEPNESAFDERL